MYKGKTVIVTGGARGIGAGVARVFARDGGATVVVADLPSKRVETEAWFKEFAQELVAERTAAGSTSNSSSSNSSNSSNSVSSSENSSDGAPRLVFVECDVTSQEQVENLVAKAVEASGSGRVDCVVANAGTHPTAKRADEWTEKEFRDLLDLNLLGAWRLCAAALPWLRKTQGNIIAISSFAGVYGQPRAATYCATKGAMTAMMKSIAIDEAEFGVRANVVSPSNIWTPLWAEHVREEVDPAGAVEGGIAAQVLGRMGSIEEVGHACLHLATAGFTTGMDYQLTGGSELGYGRKAPKIHATVEQPEGTVSAASMSPSARICGGSTSN